MGESLLPKDNLFVNAIPKKSGGKSGIGGQDEVEGLRVEG